MIILYIPFSLEESFTDLQEKTQVWTKAYEEKGKDVITVTHGVPSRYSEEINQALEKGNCKIVVLGHGINTPEFKIANQVVQDDEYRELTIQEVATNFKEDLITSSFSNENIIKLFFCDEYGQDNKSRKMAEAFRQQLGDLYRNIEVKYYTDVSIGRPGSSADSDLGGKGALRHCQMGNGAMCFKLSCLVGRAKSFREGLNEGGNPSSFFSSTEPQPIRLKYPTYSHPVLKYFAQSIVQTINRDKILSKQPHLAQQVLNILPTDLNDYLVDSLTLSTKTIVLEMKLNKAELIDALKKMGIQLPEQTSFQVVEPKPQWVEVSDFFGAAYSPFKELDDSVSFLLDDYDELMQASEDIDASIRPK